MRQRVRHVRARLDRGLFDEFLVGAISNTERYAHAQDVLGQGPVRQSRGDELRIRHDDVNIVVGIDQRAANIDGLDRSGQAVVQLDVVANAQCALEQDNQAGDEVIDDGLEAETDTDRQGTGDQRQVGKVEADRSQCDQHGEQYDRVMRQAADRVKGSLASYRLLLRDATNPHANAAR